MTLLAQYALPGIVVLSALGAMIMCLLVVRYGLSADADEDPDDADRRQVVTRIGHAAAGVCFACVAILAVVALVARPPAAPRAARAASQPVQHAAAASAAPTPAAVDDDLRKLEERLSRELNQLDDRVAATEDAVREMRMRAAAAEKRDLPPRDSVAAEAAAPRAATTPSRPAAAPRAATRPPAPADDAAAALPSELGEPRMTATVHGVRVVVHTARAGEGETIYTIRLRDTANRPLSGADVMLVGRAADGAPVRAALLPAPQPGVYQARVPASSDDPHDVRLRVAHRDRRFELSLAQAVSW